MDGKGLVEWLGGKGLVYGKGWVDGKGGLGRVVYGKGWVDGKGWVYGKG